MKNKTLERCLNIAKPHKKTIIMVSLLSIIIDLLEISKPYLVKVVLDDYLSLGISEKGFLSITTISVIYLAIVIITSIVLTIILNRIYDASKVVRTNLNTFLAESIYGAKLIKIFNIQKEKQKECEDYTSEFIRVRLPSSIFEGLFPAAMKLFENLAITIIIGVAITKWFGITVEVGSIYIFVSYIKSLFEPINRTIDSIEIVQEAIVSINKIYDII